MLMEKYKNNTDLIISSLHNDLQWIADKYIGMITLDELIEIFKQEFVSAAHRQLIALKSRVTQSEIGLVTGIGPETIRKALNTRLESPRSLPLTVEQKIVKQWSTDSLYRDPDSGKPAVLLLTGPRPTFQGLVNRITRGITPKTALNSLRRLEAVRLVDNYWIELTDPNWQRLLPLQLEYLGKHWISNPFTSRRDTKFHRR